MRINILTIFPEFFESPLRVSMLARAQKNELVNLHVYDIRRWAVDKHHTTDDRPYGGGPGMVMKIEPIDLALKALGVKKSSTQTANSRIVLLSARGKQFDQQLAREYAELRQLTLICGHYGDVDQRVAEHLVDEELSVGEFVLTGGEPAALLVLDATFRLLPGVLGNQSSVLGETHDEPGHLSPPQYTRPAEYNGWQVPEVLLSGDPKKIIKLRPQAKQN